MIKSVSCPSLAIAGNLTVAKLEFRNSKLENDAEKEYQNCNVAYMVSMLVAVLRWLNSFKALVMYTLINNHFIYFRTFH